LAVRILAAHDAGLRARMADFQRALERLVLDKDESLRATMDTPRGK
jgi:5-(carboxyamino)imidazole ribonucleotide mutase